MKVGGAYVVDWLDHCQNAGETHAWIDRASVEPELALIHSVGFVVAETEEAIVITHTMDSTECLQPFSIVRAAIVRVQELRLTKPPAPKKGKP